MAQALKVSKSHENFRHSLLTWLRNSPIPEGARDFDSTLTISVLIINNYETQFASALVYF